MELASRKETEVAVGPEHAGLVSVVMPFLDTPERFFEEAIRSVLTQTYRDWELLLVDDGSASAAAGLALRTAAAHPDRIRYLEHEGHANRGLSESRLVGVSHAKGEYVAFLDSDDVWLPEKLAAQVDILRSQPEAAMVYGNTRYWYGWTGRAGDVGKDFSPRLGVRSGSLFRPPTLLVSFLRGRAAVPPPCSVIVRRETLLGVPGLDEAYGDSLYEDQALWAKLALNAPIYVSTTCWDLYRQHESSLTAAATTVAARESRIRYLEWLDGYLTRHGLRWESVVEALRKEQWLCSADRASPRIGRSSAVRLVKKWMIRGEESLVPARIRRRWWCAPEDSSSPPAEQ